MPRQINCYCAFCRTQRKVYAQKHMGQAHTLASILLGLAVNGLFFGDVDARALPWMVFFALCSEVIVQYRWRMSIVCPHCGFDPVLYLRDSKKACERVKAHLVGRRNDPNFYLSRTPVLKLPMRQISKSKIERLKEIPIAKKLAAVPMKQKALRTPNENRNVVP